MSLAEQMVAEPPKIELEYAFSVRIDFKERVRWETPVAHRVWVPATGGTVWGPKLQGRVVPYSGADYANAYGLDAHYVLQAEDGAHIYIHNRGYLYPLNGEKPNLEDPRWGGDGEFYFRLTPQFDAEKGPHDWLNKTVIVGTGKRAAYPEDHTVFTYYIVK